MATSSLTFRVCPNLTRRHGDATGASPQPDDSLVEDLSVHRGVARLGRDRTGRRRRWPVVFAVVVVILVVATLIAGRISINYYVLTPGDATPVAQFIDVPAADNHPLTGKILLTDVFVTQLNALNYLQYRFFDSDSEVVSGPELLGPTPNESQYLAQGYLQMAQAQSFATAAALTHLGYTVTPTNAGALIYGIEPHSPAAATLHVAQVITAVNGTPTTTECSLVNSLHGLTPGSTVALKVEESSINGVGEFVPGPIVTKSVTLGTPPKGLVETGCGAAGQADRVPRHRPADAAGLALPRQGHGAHTGHRRTVGRLGHDARHHRQAEQRAPDGQPDRGRHRDDRPVRQCG